MTGRETILERIRKNKPEGKPLSGSFQVSINTQRKEKPLVLFKDSLGKAGAEIREFVSKEELDEHIKNKFPDAINLTNNQTKEQYKTRELTKSELEMTKILIVEGRFGVAENGAIWITEEDASVRLFPFVTQRLTLVLDKKQIESDMHEAYQRVEFSKTGFGVFISGPSKTADIEQSLVYGAHGAKELTVLIHA